MGEANYTPGPWTIDPYDAEPRIRTDGGHVIVPRVWGQAADAHLIAAAPDLFAALIDLTEWVEAFTEATPEADQSPILAGLAANARAAIAKASPAP